MNYSSFPEKSVAGAILVGGRSRRFGQDKVLLTFRGKPLLAHLCGILSPLVEETLIVGHSRPEFEALRIRAVEDLWPGAGPLGGIYTALKSAGTPFVLVVAADMPFLTPSLLEKILRAREGQDAVIPQGPGRLEPLCAVYSRTCLDAIRENLENGRNRILSALEGKKVCSPRITPEGTGKDPFFNINYPEDYKKLEA